MRKGEKIYMEAMNKAGEVLGADPAYFGDDGQAEVVKQLKEMGYTMDDLHKLDAEEEAEARTHKPIKKLSELRHRKGGEYFFLGVIHPYCEKPAYHVHIEGEQMVFHTELERWFKIKNYFNGTTMVSYSDDREINEYLVAYQSKLDEKAENLYARPLQMFFEHVQEADGWSRRFEVIQR